MEPLEGNKVKVSIEVDEAEFDKAIDAAFRKIARETRIPGFRPGKAPRRILEARFGTDVARDEVSSALQGEYRQATTPETWATLETAREDVDRLLRGSGG